MILVGPVNFFLQSATCFEGFQNPLSIPAFLETPVAIHDQKNPFIFLVLIDVILEHSVRLIFFYPLRCLERLDVSQSGFHGLLFFKSKLHQNLSDFRTNISDFLLSPYPAFTVYTQKSLGYLDHPFAFARIPEKVTNCWILSVQPFPYFSGPVHVVSYFFD